MLNCGHTGPHAQEAKAPPGILLEALTGGLQNLMAPQELRPKGAQQQRW